MKVTLVYSSSGIVVAAFFDNNKAIKYLNKYNYNTLKEIEVRDAVVCGGRQGAPPPTQFGEGLFNNTQEK
jgi:hypothetical protein